MDKWDNVDKRVRAQKESANGSHPMLPRGAGLVAVAPAAAPTPQVAEPTTIVARVKANMIQRKIGVAQLDELYKAQMDLIRHQLKEAVRARKAEATEAADRYLLELNRSHLNFLAELGLKNVDKRQEIVIELNERTSQRLSDIMNRDWPASLKDHAVDEILDMNKDFAERLRHELG
jgi:hypothetical protein